MHLKGEQEEGKGGHVPSAAAAISALGCTGSRHLLFVVSPLPADGVTACPGPGPPAAGHSFPCAARAGQNMQTREGWEERDRAHFRPLALALSAPS